MFGGRIPGQRFDVVERQQIAAAERAQRAGDILVRRAQSAQRQILGTASSGIGLRARGDQEMGLAAAGTTAEKHPRCLGRIHRIVQQCQRHAVATGDIGIKALLRRPAQRQRQLAAHALPAGAGGGLVPATAAVSTASGTTMTGACPALYSALFR